MAWPSEHEGDFTGSSLLLPTLLHLQLEQVFLRAAGRGGIVAFVLVERIAAFV